MIRSDKLWISLATAVMVPLALLVLLIWVFSLSSWVGLVKTLLALFIFSKNLLFTLLILCIIYFVFYFANFCPDHNYFYSSVTWSLFFFQNISCICYFTYLRSLLFLFFSILSSFIFLSFLSLIYFISFTF